MDVFRRLQALKDFEQEHLRVLATVEDHNLVREIGFHQAGGTPLTLKQLFLRDIGSVATVQRRLRRLRQLGVVQQRRAQSDRRAVELMLTPKYVKLFRKYGERMSEQPDYRHICGIYGDDQTLHETTAVFLAEGVGRSQKCVLFSCLHAAEGILAAVERLERGARNKIIVRDFADTPAGQLAQLREALAGGRRGESVRIAGDASRALARGMSLDGLFAYEGSVDDTTLPPGAQVLCQYDARKLSGVDLVRALRCHPESARHPLLLGTPASP